MPDHVHDNRKKSQEILSDATSPHSKIDIRMSSIKGRRSGMGGHGNYDAGANLSVHNAEYGFRDLEIADQQQPFFAKLNTIIRNNLEAAEIPLSETRSQVESSRLSFLADTDDITGQDGPASDAISDKMFDIVTATVELLHEKLGRDKNKLQDVLDGMVQESEKTVQPIREKVAKAKAAALQHLQENPPTMSAKGAEALIHNVVDLIGMKNADAFAKALGEQIATTFPTAASVTEAGDGALRAAVEEALTNGIGEAGTDDYVAGVQKSSKKAETFGEPDIDTTADKIQYAADSISKALESRYEVLEVDIGTKGGRSMGGDSTAVGGNSA